MVQVYKNVIYFQKPRLALRRFWVKEPHHSEVILQRKCATSIVERTRKQEPLSNLKSLHSQESRRRETKVRWENMRTRANQ